MMPISVSAIMAVAEICRLSLGADMYLSTVYDTVHNAQVSCQQQMIACTKNRDANVPEADALAECVMRRTLR